MNSLVSVYIPTFNRPDFLRRALLSLLNQSYKNIEVLICDDGSSCDLSVIKEEFKDKFPVLKWVRNETSLGACASRNILIKMASGDYITGLDDDDEFLPDRINSFLNAPELSRYPFLCSSNYIFTGKMIYKGSRYYGKVQLDELLNSNIVGNQIFTKTEYLKNIGGFDENFPSWQDYDTWVRMVLKYGAGFKLNKATYKMNIDHELNRITNSSKAHLGYERFIEKHSDILTDKNKTFLSISDKINRKCNLTYSDICFLFANGGIHRLAKFFFKKIFF